MVCNNNSILPCMQHFRVVQIDLQLDGITCITVCPSGVLCRSFSFPNEICPGDNVTFTCVVVDPTGISFTVWIVEGGEQDCILRHNKPNEVATCGPEQLFTSSFINQNGDNYTSTLSVESISDDLNRTRVECEDTVMEIGKENICIIGKSYAHKHFLCTLYAYTTYIQRETFERENFCIPCF